MRSTFASLLCVLCLLAVLPGLARALSLGEPIGQAVIGQPLKLRIPLRGADAAGLGKDCVRLAPDDGEAADDSLKSASLLVGNQTVTIETRQAVSQPLLGFRLHVECGRDLSRHYQLFPMPPGREPPLPSPVQMPTPPSPPPAPSDPRDYTVTMPTTLRLISRQQYPQDSKARYGFIRRVFKANPGVFSGFDAAFDQPLSPGVRLRMPTEPPVRVGESAPPAPSAPPPKAAAAAKSPGQGRLVIGAGTPAMQPLAEIEADISRLSGVMNEQILVQISMVERLRLLEQELVRTREATAQQQALNQRLEADVRELRAEQQRNSSIQLVLAILLGGFAGSALLHWRAQRSTSLAG